MTLPISIPILQYLPETMVHTSKVYKYASYEEYRDNGMFSSEANCMQFLYDMKILRTNHQCSNCLSSMTLQECPLPCYKVQRRMLLEVQVWKESEAS